MVRPLGVVFAVLVATGCALVEPATRTGPLVTIEAHGGRCPEGECRSVIAIERDGRIHRLEPDPGDMAEVSGETIVAIEAAIAVTDFAALRSRPFTGVCPTAADGQEHIYTFATPSGSQRIASCEVEIDPEQPLFVTVQAALGATPP
jgi:hypothetical protein